MALQICIIKPNEIEITEETLTNNFSKDDIYKNIINCINFEETTNETLMLDIVKYLDLENFKYKNNVTIETTTILEDEHYKYDMCHLPIYDTIEIYEENSQTRELCNRINKDIQNRGINKLANILNRSQFNTFGSSVIIKMKINNNKITNTTFNSDDLNNLIYSNLVYNGVKISLDSNGENIIENFKFIKSPLEILNSEKINNILNYRYYEVDLSSRILMIFIELKPSINQKNKLASLFFNNSVTGNVIFSMRKRNTDIRFNHHIFIDIDDKLLEKIATIYNYNSDNYEIKEDSNKLDNKLDNSDNQIKENKYTNFYININDKYDEYIKNTPIEKIINRLIETTEKSLNEISLEQVEKTK